MPFVNIRIYEGWGKERKDEIAKRVTGAITDVTGLPKEAVWVVIEEVKPSDWYAAGKPGEPIRARWLLEMPVQARSWRRQNYCARRSGA